jgi:hypothetical protein
MKKLSKKALFPFRARMSRFKAKSNRLATTCRLEHHSTASNPQGKTPKTRARERAEHSAACFLKTSYSKMVVVTWSVMAKSEWK